MGVICIVRNTTASDGLQVAITYTFDLAVRTVRGQIASNFFKRVHMFNPSIFLKLTKIASILHYDIFIIESLKCLVVSDVSQCLYLMSDMA